MQSIVFKSSPVRRRGGRQERKNHRDAPKNGPYASSPTRFALSHGTRTRSRNRDPPTTQSFPTQRSYSRRTPAHSLTTPLTAAITGMSRRGGCANATARRQPESGLLPPLHPTHRPARRRTYSAEKRAIFKYACISNTFAEGRVKVLDALKHVS